jgi:hypothetical protein
MSEIKCPNCETVFSIDEAQYAEIMSQVKTVEFEKELHQRLELAEQANVNCKNTAYYLKKYRPDLASICSGWCDAIDTAMQSNTEGN